MKRILGYTLLMGSGIVILALLAYLLPLTIFFKIVVLMVLLTIVIIKGIE